ncbi:MAG: PAAR domain-containing protein [Shewanella oncorhynchi]
MGLKAIIREGDPTSHGGTVIEGFAGINIYGKPAAGVGHKGVCPKCKCQFVIVAGVVGVSYLGRNVAVEGMLTSCGATLIATQKDAMIEAPSRAALPASKGKASSVVEASSSSLASPIVKEKEIKRIYWSYGKNEIPLAEVSRFYSDMNVHVETLNYQVGESVEVIISGGDEHELSDGVAQITLTAIVQADGKAKIINALKDHSVEIYATA